MAIDKPIVHRAGSLKQFNKQHKHGSHRSKGAVNSDSKGKISVKTISKKNKRELNKEARRNQITQIRQSKRDEVLSKKRSLGGFDRPPFLVCIIPLVQDFDCNTTLNILIESDSEAVVKKSPSGVTHIYTPRFKQKFAFVIPPTDNDFAILDTLKVCDTVLFLISAIGGMNDDQLIDKWGRNMLLTTFSQGLPTPIVAVSDLESIAPKKRNDHKQYIQKLVNKWLPEEKVIPVGSYVDGMNILRKIGNQKKKSVLYRDRRPHLYAEHVEYLPDSNGSTGCLKVSGYQRGTPLCVNDLIHIPGLGDYQMSQIDAPFDPYTVDKKNDNRQNKATQVLQKCDISKQESLDSENIPDPMDSEQTWPTQEEIEEAKNETKMKKVKKVPKGWSDYQAAWIADSDNESQSEFDNQSDNSDDDMEDAISEEESDNEDDRLDTAEKDDNMETDTKSEENRNKEKNDDEKSDTMTETGTQADDNEYDEQIDKEKEKEELEKIKAAKIAAAKGDKMFPDEMDTPFDKLAKIRFQKYRGLESFRTSPWDPKENLPSDYSRIFQFANFDRTKRRVLKEKEKEKKEEEATGVSPTQYITVHVKDVPQILWDSFQTTKSPVVIIGLFPHEHKMSIINTVLKRTPNYDFPIKSKEKLIFQCGYRRFIVNPIFSQHTNGQKHKFERFFQPESTVVATFYGPIQFPPAPILCYKEINNNLVLVATGNLLSCNPDRIILKRIVLSGHPFKIFKKSAVIRFMFFNPEDIMYFKPCKLRTKMGRTGHIKEPLGTHGHMKCVFDGQLKSEDTVILNLYKRIYPKWTYEDLIVSCAPAPSNSNMEIEH